MKKVIKRIINSFLSFLFLFIKNENKKAKIYTRISKLLFNKNNNIEFDKELNVYWLKHGYQYLFAVKKPYFNYSLSNLYSSINSIYCKKYTPKQGDVILDIGAGIGTETLFFSEKAGNAGKIYNIEASPDSYKKLNKLCEKNNFKNTHNFNLAISNFNGSIWIEENENFEINQTNNKQKGIEISCISLDEFIKQNNIISINFLKVNIEGAELEMIEGMSNAVHIIKNLAISCHDFLFNENKEIKSKISNFFIKNGFEIHYNQTGNKVTDSWIYGSKT